MREKHLRASLFRCGAVIKPVLRFYQPGRARGAVLRTASSDGRSARLDMTGLGAGLYLARWGRNSQAVLLGN